MTFFFPSLLLLGSTAVSEAVQIRQANAIPQRCWYLEPKAEDGTSFDHAAKNDAGFVQTRLCDENDEMQQFMLMTDGSIRPEDIGVGSSNFCVSSAGKQEDPKLRLPYCKVNGGVTEPNSNQVWTFPQGSSPGAIYKRNDNGDADQCVELEGAIATMRTPPCLSGDVNQQWEVGNFTDGVNRVDTFPRVCGGGLGTGDDCSTGGNNACDSCCCHNNPGSIIDQTCVNIGDDPEPTAYNTCPDDNTIPITPGGGVRKLGA